jgi:hypothetical protein
VLYGVRTFLDPDNAEPRSPNRPEAALSYTQENKASTALDAIQTRFLVFRASNPPATSQNDHFPHKIVNFEKRKIALEFFGKDIKIRKENMNVPHKLPSYP